MLNFVKRCSLVFVLASTIGGAVSAGDPMDEFAWSARPVIVFAASENDPLARNQLARLDAERDGLRERDMVVISLWPDRSEVDGELSALSPDGMRERYSVSPASFAVLLVGKDTGVKARASAPVDPQELFSRVDGMPMRQREIRKQASD